MYKDKECRRPVGACGLNDTLKFNSEKLKVNCTVLVSGINVS
jgi:hypothetical protein